MRTPCAAQLPRPVCGRARPADHEVAALVAPPEGNSLSTAQYPLPELYLPTAAPYSEYCTHSEYYLPPASQRESFFHTCRRARVCSGTCAYVPTCAITHARGLSACVRACVRRLHMLCVHTRWRSTMSRSGRSRSRRAPSRQPYPAKWE